MRAQQRRVAEDRGDRSVGDDPACLQHHGARGEVADQSEVVRRDQLRLRQAAQQRDQVGAGSGRERGGGLVEREDRGPHREHRGDRDALLLAQAEAVRGARLVAAHPHLGEGGPRPPQHLVLDQPLVQRPVGDVVEHGRREELVVRIREEQPDLRPDRGEARVLQALAAHLDHALAAQQPVELQQQRRLARAVRAEQRDPLAGGDLEVDAIEARRAVRVGVADAAQHELGRGSRLSRRHSRTAICTA